MSAQLKPYVVRSGFYTCKSTSGTEPFVAPIVKSPTQALIRLQLSEQSIN